MREKWNSVINHLVYEIINIHFFSFAFALTAIDISAVVRIVYHRYDIRSYETIDLHFKCLLIYLGINK